jgi:hypothetical protein
MKSVLISIQPKWCELIANGKKTVEVRKTRPKLDVPFKVYIYCTQQKVNGEILLTFNKKVEGRNRGFRDKGDIPLAGKVIGEFVCDRIDEIGYSPEMHGQYISDIKDLHKVTCIDFEQMFDYIADGYGYGWHISDLEIYDTPKELGKYIVPSKIGCCNEGKCRGCKWFDRGNGFNLEDDCNAKFDTDEYKPLRRPPQSWCYVEELK